MEIVIQPTVAAANALAARLFAKVIRKGAGCVLGLATGDTPLMLYRELIEMNLDWRNVTTFNLDEYVGLAPNHPQSYNSFIWEHLLRHVTICKQNVHIPDGLAKDIPNSCAKYEDEIRSAGGIDIQLLGIGTDGHIGFNEPTSSLGSRTRIKTLTPQTRRDNARFFLKESDVPRHCITMGIATILEARNCILLAFGKNKARAIAEAVEGAVTSMNPASALQLHPNTTVILDEDAASDLKLGDYYRWIYDNKPDWQKT
jgi:glucosamine-6-phosphate deaminase